MLKSGAAKFYIKPFIKSFSLERLSRLIGRPSVYTAKRAIKMTVLMSCEDSSARIVSSLFSVQLRFCFTARTGGQPNGQRP